MSVQVEKVIRRIEHSLGGPLSSSIDPTALINDVGEFLCTLHPWRWLERQSTPIDLVAGRPYAELPLNFPGDVRDIVAYNAADSLVNSLTFTSHEHLLRLRTYQIQNTSFNYYGVISHRSGLRNLLNYTETFAPATVHPFGTPFSTEWRHVAGLALTYNQGRNPIDGANTVVAVNATTPGSALAREVGPEWAGRRLRSGVYVASGYLHEGGPSPAAKTAIDVHGGHVGEPLAFQTAVSYEWATGIATLESTAGAGTHDFRVVQLHDKWIRLEVAASYSEELSADGVHWDLYPSELTTTGSCLLYGPQLEYLEREPGAPVPSARATAYQPVLGEQPIVGDTPRPVLSLYPVPTTDETGKLAIVYRAGWPTLDRDDEVISIPNYLTGWFIEACKEWARGVDEEDNASISERVTNLLVGQRDMYGMPRNELLRACMLRDIEIQPDDGPLENGAVGSRQSWVDWGNDAIVEGPA